MTEGTAERCKAPLASYQEDNAYLKRALDHQERYIAVLSERLRRTCAEKDAAIADRDAALAQRDVTAADRDAAVVQRDAALADRDAALAQRDAAIAREDTAVAQKATAVAERDAAVAERDAAVAERDAAIAAGNLAGADYQKQTAALRARLFDIENSTSWRVTEPVRAALSGLRGGRKK